MAIPYQTPKQRFALISAMVRTKSGYTLDGHQLREMVKQEWGLDYDWHVTADTLDAMQIRGEVARHGMGADRMVTYLIP